jgi:hypothetical protein
MIPFSVGWKIVDSKADGEEAAWGGERLISTLWKKLRIGVDIWGRIKKSPKVCA